MYRKLNDESKELNEQNDETKKWGNKYLNDSGLWALFGWFHIRFACVSVYVLVFFDRLALYLQLSDFFNWHERVSTSAWIKQSDSTNFPLRGSKMPFIDSEKLNWRRTRMDDGVRRYRPFSVNNNIGTVNAHMFVESNKINNRLNEIIIDNTPWHV